jgi:hypothetical protein
MVVKVVVACLAVGCGGGDKPAPVATGSGSGSAVVAIDAAVVAAADAATIDPKLMAARCEEPCLFLLDTPVDKVADAFHAACGKQLTPALTDCAQLDIVRKCVFAAHGFVFKDKRWKVYEKRSWYVANPSFRPTQITELEHRNVVELDTRAKNCKNGIQISAGDAKLVEAWAAGIRKEKPKLPKVVLLDGTPCTDDSFTAMIYQPLARLDAQLDLKPPTTVVYDEDVAIALRDHIKPLPAGKLRAIVIRRSGFPEDEPDVEWSIEIALVYDDHDHLIAVSTKSPH